MHTYVADKVLNYGLIVAKANNKNEAMHLIMKEFPMFYKKCNVDESCELEYCLQHRLILFPIMFSICSFTFLISSILFPLINDCII